MKVIRVTDSSVFVSNEEGSFLEYPKSSLNFKPQVGDEVQLSADGMKLEKLASKIEFFDDNSKKKHGILKEFQKFDVSIRANLICLLFSIILSAILFFTSTKEEFFTNIAISIFLMSIFLIATNCILLCWSLFKKHGKLIKKSLLFLLCSFILLLISAFLQSSNSNQKSSSSSDNKLNTVGNEKNGQDYTETTEESNKVIDTDKKNYKVVDFDKWNHDDENVAYTDKVLVKGKVVESNADGNDGQVLRIALNDDYDTIVYGYISSEDYKDVIAKDDQIAAYGSANGLITYRTILKSELTIPYMDIYFYDLNEAILEEETKYFEKNTIFNQGGILFEQITNDTFEITNNGNQEISLSVDSLDVNGKVVDDFNLVDLYGDLKPGQNKTVKLRDTDNLMKKGSTVNFTIDIYDTNYNKLYTFDASIILQEDILSKY
ncbi:TIGR04086 family membrane protein [Streptococcus pluranimalium]